MTVCHRGRHLCPLGGHKFTYLAPPTVTKVSPAQGYISGRALVTITGTNLADASLVVFGGAGSGRIVEDTAAQITVYSPETFTAGVVNVEVIDPNGFSAISAADKFTYLAPLSITMATDFGSSRQLRH